jgi:hypothetical protein
MKAIHINSYVTEKDPRNPIPCYVYRPDDPSDDAKLEEMGWKRRNLYEGDYFYWTESELIADWTAMDSGISIEEPREAPIWRINYHPERNKAK